MPHPVRVFENIATVTFCKHDWYEGKENSPSLNEFSILLNVPAFVLCSQLSQIHSNHIVQGIIRSIVFQCLLFSCYQSYFSLEARVCQSEIHERHQNAYSL